MVLKTPFCTDCKGCHSTLKVFYEDQKSVQSYEYVAVEFSRDREFQTQTWSTSQDTLGLYLHKAFPSHLCILGAGAYDVQLNITVE
jgi:hypothetical protein